MTDSPKVPVDFNIPVEGVPGTTPPNGMAWEEMDTSTAVGDDEFTGNLGIWAEMDTTTTVDSYNDGGGAFLKVE